MHKLNSVAAMKPSEQGKDTLRCMSHCMHLTGEFLEVVRLPNISNNAEAENNRQRHFQEIWSLTAGFGSGCLAMGATFAERGRETHSRAKNKHCCSALDFPRV